MLVFEDYIAIFYITTGRLNLMTLTGALGRAQRNHVMEMDLYLEIVKNKLGCTIILFRAQYGLQLVAY